MDFQIALRMRYFAKHLHAHSCAKCLSFLLCLATACHIKAAEPLLLSYEFIDYVSASSYMFTSETQAQHVEEMERDPLRFIREKLIPSIEDPILANRENLNWEMNTGSTVENDSANGLTWFYFDIANNSTNEIETLIEFTDFDGVGWVYQDESGMYQFSQPDYQSYLGGRPIFDTQSVIPRTIQANSTDRFIGIFYSVSVPRTSQVRLWEPEGFRENRAKRHFGDGIYYGILLALAFYNLTLFYVMRQKSYLYAGLFQLCVGSLIFIGTGYSTIFLLPNNLDFTIPVYGSLFFLTLIFGALFSIEILQIRITHAFLYKFWIAAIIWSIIQIPIVSISALPNNLEPNSILFISLINAIFFVAIQALHIYTLIYFWNRSSKAKYWFIAVTLQVWLLVAWQLSEVIGYGIVDISRYLVQIFTIVNAAVLTWLIGDSIQEEQRQREIAQNEALSSLEIANAIQQSKSNFISTAGHDLRQPLEAIR